MRALLDVNVLISLLDSDHALHRRAYGWFEEHAPGGWATCPITQNGCVRVMTNPSYPNSVPIRQLIERLRDATQSPYHEFWPDDVSLLDPMTADAGRILGARQITDLYLLALAVRRDGLFVTFDAAVAPGAIVGADRRHVVSL